MAAEKNKDSFAEIAGGLVRFSLPLIFSGILQQLYNWADAFIVGNTEGGAALAAIGATGTVINFFLIVITGFSGGLSVLFGQKFGRGERESLTKLLSTYVLLCGAVFTVLAAFGAGLSPLMLQLLHTTPDTVELSESYLRIVFMGLPFLAVYNIYSVALRGVGDSRAPFYSILVSSVVNILLDILLVVVLKKGVRGAAAATMASQAAMTVFIILYTIKCHPVFRFSLKPASVDRTSLKEGLSFGIPPMIQSSVGAFGSLLLQNFMNSFGTQTVTAITTAYRVDSVVMLPIVNLGSGISTIVAQNHGAGNEKRAKQVLGAGTALMTAVSLSLTLFIVSMGGSLVAAFGTGREAAAIGREFFWCLGRFYVVYGFATAMRGYLQGSGEVVLTSTFGILSLVFRIAASYVIAPWCGNMAIAYAELFAWVIMLISYASRIVWKWRRESVI